MKVFEGAAIRDVRNYLYGTVLEIAGNSWRQLGFLDITTEP